MTDINIVIRGLTCLARKAQDGTCEGCAYFRPFTDDPNTGWCDSAAIMNDAVELLKEQEPVTPIYKSDMPFCGACRYAIPRTINYCHHCGKKVNWDAAEAEGRIE